MFHSARLKLTLWYVIIATIITAFFSLLSYNGLRVEFERGLQRQRVFLFQQESPDPDAPPNIVFRRIDPQIEEEMRERLIFRILYIDAALIAVAALGGYFLAGRTLRPIKAMVDEQNRFITDASHELRTPLTALRSEMEATLLDKELSSKDAQTLIKSNLEEVINLQSLSDSLLELTRFSKANNHRANEDVSLLQITEDALKKVMPLAKKKKISVYNEVTDITLKGDPHQLTELFVILLDNAFKYSPAKTEVNITSKSVDHSVLIKVIDQGMGIEEEDLPHIFDRFYRSDKSRTRTKTSGYGLGLAIAQQIVDEHKGTITVKSKVNEGTSFSITLPRKK